MTVTRSLCVSACVCVRVGLPLIFAVGRKGWTQSSPTLIRPLYKWQSRQGLGGQKRDLTQILLPPRSAFSCLRCAAWSSLRICSYKYVNLQVNFFGGVGLCRRVWRHFESETSHMAPKHFRYVFHLTGHQFIVKMSTGPSLAFQWKGLIFQVIGSRQEKLRGRVKKKGKSWNNAMWLRLVANHPWKMGNKFLRGILHSSSPHTSWLVNNIKRFTDSWREACGGAECWCLHMKHIYVSVKPSKWFMVRWPWHPLIAVGFWYDEDEDVRVDELLNQVFEPEHIIASLTTPKT